MIKYIKGFDGLRAISILFVLLTHLGLYDYYNNPILKLSYGLCSGSNGVMIFFSISGFLITSLLLKEKEKHGDINFKFFFIRRFLRLLPPLLILFSAVLVLMGLELIPPNYNALLFAFFYIFNFAPIKYYTFELGHTWSLAIEEQFYFIWPFVINYMKSLRNILLFALTLIVISLIWKVIFISPTLFNGVPNSLTQNYYVARWFIPACLPIMIGSLTSIFLFKRQALIQQYLHNNYLFLVLPLLLYTSRIYLPALIHSVALHNIEIPFLILQPLGVSLFLLWIYFNQDSLIVNGLELKPISFLGKISYGVYVYQGLFLGDGPNRGSLSIQTFPINLCLVFITAIISYYWVEKKLMNYKDHFKRSAA